MKCEVCGKPATKCCGSIDQPMEWFCDEHYRTHVDEAIRPLLEGLEVDLQHIIECLDQLGVPAGGPLRERMDWLVRERAAKIVKGGNAGH